MILKGDFSLQIDFRISSENDFFDLPENNVDYQNSIDFLANRISIRNFKNKPVSDETINQILTSVSYAPFGAEPEKVNATIVNNRKTIESALPYIEGFLDNIVTWIENPIASFMIFKKRPGNI